MFWLPFDCRPRFTRAPEVVPGSYVTDGQNLFRVVAQFDPDAECRFAALEDCRTLEVRRYSPDELVAMGLRPVRSAPQPAIA